MSCSATPDARQADLELPPDKRNGGRLELDFALAPGGRTFVKTQYSSYPFHVCRPFYLDAGSAEGMATVYTQSCSGGLYSQEKLATKIAVGPKAQAQVTTQASTIVHKASYGETEQHCEIFAGDEALVEYLPDATILFPGAGLHSSVKATLAPSASMILFDSFLAHDYSSEDAVFDHFQNEIAIQSSDNIPLAIDRFRILGADFQQNRVGQMAGFGCHGSVTVIAPNTELGTLIDALRTVFVRPPDAMIGLSRLSSNIGMSARILTSDAVTLKSSMIEIWKQSRAAITGTVPRERMK